ncbi:MAG: LamG-like jellyroll fold domain-containing protein [Candidatus Omnitrophota bacterium]
MKKIFILFITVIISLIALSASLAADYGKEKIIFLHHSTGRCIYDANWYGDSTPNPGPNNVADWILDYNALIGREYYITDNIDSFTGDGYSKPSLDRYYPNSNYPRWDNYPFDYWDVWVNHSDTDPYLGQWNIGHWTTFYDVIIFKHCYPVSSIAADSGPADITSRDKEIQNYKLQYNALKAKLHEFSDKKFIIWSGAAKTKASISEVSAMRARQFFDWVKNEWDEPGDNIYLWNFFDLETGGEGPDNIYMKDEYANTLTDSHPNDTFSSYAAPLLARRIIDVLNSPEPQPGVSFVEWESSGAESETSVSIPVKLFGSWGSKVTVKYSVIAGTASAGDDYILAAGVLEFAPGEIVKNISFAVNDDVLPESDETIVISLLEPTAAPLVWKNTYTYTIIDNDPLPDCMVGHWKFNEESGETAKDSTAYNNDAALKNGPEWVSNGKIKGALSFDGIDDCVVAADAAVLDNTEKLTVCFWAYPTILDGKARAVISKRAGMNSNQSYTIFFYTGNQLYIDIDGSGDRFCTNKVFEKDNWYHVAVVYDGSLQSSERVKVYINGDLDRSALETSAKIPDYASNLCLGMMNEGYSQGFAGLIDDIRVIRNALSKEEIEEIINSKDGIDYYVSNSGEDNNDGMSISDPWKTIAKVNEFSFSPGDTIHFERGGLWRENLYPQSGEETACIKYTSYGDENKPKPVLLGSQNKNKPEDWVDEGKNIWSTRFPSVTGSELLFNPSFNENTDNWELWAADGAIVNRLRDTAVYDSSPAGYRVNCGNNNGEYFFSIQLSAYVSKIISGKYYELSFRAKADQAFEIYPIKLLQGGSEAYWNFYVGTPGKLKYLISASISTEWKTYKVYYQANRSASDARVLFFLGNALPENSNFYIDTLSFKEIEEVPFLVDVGNIIFDDAQDISFKVWEESDLDKQNEFWYDENNMVLKVYSAQNPAVLYQNIECSLNRDIIEESHKHHIIYDDLYLAYGGYDGIGGGYAHDITIRNCDMCFIGGSDQYGGTITVRYGNAVEFWNATNNDLIENCNFWEIFDSALTNQGDGPGEVQRDIIYRNNKMWNCERTFETWFNSSTGAMHDIYFENNLLLNAGGGWGHQRFPGEIPAGRQIVLAATLAETRNIYIRNNIISKADWTCLHFSSGWAIGSANLENLVLDYNTYYQPRDFGRIAFCYNYGAGTSKSYYNDSFEQYKSDTGKDIHSILYEYEYIGIEALGSDPADEEINVAKDKEITINFSKDIKPYCDYARISLRDPNGRQVKITKSINNNILYIKPDNLESEGIYSVFIPIGAVSSLDGYEILGKDYKFSFTFNNKLVGDLNADGQVNSLDLQLCVNILLGVDINPEIIARADLDNNGEINAVDLQQLVNLLLGVMKTVMVSDCNGSILEAVSAIGSNLGVLIIDKSIIISGSIDIPENISIEVIEGAYLIPAKQGVKLTINKFKAGRYLCFNPLTTGDIDAGDWVVFNDGAVSEVYPEWFKGSDNYWHTYIQKAINAAEESRIPINFAGEKTYEIHGTIYLGESPWVSDGTAVIKISCDESFERIGGAILKNEGAILMKSALGASYEKNVITPKIYGIKIEFDRNNKNIEVCINYENIKGGYLKNSRIYNSEGNPNFIDPFVLYRNVQDFAISNCVFSSLTGHEMGGSWVRNSDPSNPTQNITINKCSFISNQGDESFAIFTPPSSDNCVVRNVTVEDCVFKHIGEDIPVVIFIGAMNNTGRVENVTFRNCEINSEAPVSGHLIEQGRQTFNVKMTGCKLSFNADTREDMSGARVPAATPRIVEGLLGFEYVEDTQVEIKTIKYDTGRNDIAAFNKCGRVINCSNKYSIVAHSHPIAALETEHISGCDLMGYLDDCPDVVDTRIDIPPWDNAPPAPEITTQPFITEFPSGIINGTCDSNIKAIYVNNSIEGVSFNPDETNWNYSYNSLKPGENIFIVTAENKDGIQSAASFITISHVPINPVIYENAEDLNTNGWNIYDSDPAGATISNVYDNEHNSRVIELKGDRDNNGYLLKKENGSPWQNKYQFVIEWNMKYSENFTVYIDVVTDTKVNGTGTYHRYIQYDPVDNNKLGNEEYVLLGIGSNIKDGKWHTIICDLQSDLELAQPGVKILEVNGFLIRGSGRVDDIKAYLKIPD